MPRTINYRLYIAWDGTNYTAESTRLIQASGENRLTAPEQVATGRGIVDRCTLELDNADGRYSPLNTSGALYANIQAGGAYHRPMYLEVSIDGGSNYYRVFTGVIKLPQERSVTPMQPASVTIDCRSRDELLLGRRMSTNIYDMQDMHLAGATEGDVISYWLTQAGYSGTIDGGMFPIPWSWLDDESVLEEVWQLASACGGRFYADPDGTLRYEDATHWLKSPHTTSQETLTRADFQAFEPQYTDTDLYSAVTAEASERAPGNLETLWEPDAPLVVPPATTKTIVARFKQAAYDINWPPTFTATTPSGVDITGSITATMTAANVQRLTMTLANADSTNSARLHPFYVFGTPLVGGPTQEEARDSATHGSNGAWWSGRSVRSKAIRSNAYIQTRAQAGSLALMLLHRSERARLTYKLRGCPGNPARRCGDRITINDTTIMSSARDAFITGINWRLTRNGLTQDIEAIDAANLFANAAYFVIGTSKLGASGTGTAPLFY
jgi:hypothetical protein